MLGIPRMNPPPAFVHKIYVIFFFFKTNNRLQTTMPTDKGGECYLCYPILSFQVNTGREKACSKSKMQSNGRDTPQHQNEAPRNSRK